MRAGAGVEAHNAELQNRLDMLDAGYEEAVKHLTTLPGWAAATPVQKSAKLAQLAQERLNRRLELITAFPRTAQPQIGGGINFDIDEAAQGNQ
jgi:Lon protease-like protein